MKKEKTLYEKRAIDIVGFTKYYEKDVKEFIADSLDDIEDCVMIKVKDVPKHMEGIDLTWLDKEIEKIKDRLRGKLKRRVGYLK